MILLLCALVLGNVRCLADGVSGPNHSTIQSFPWGSIYYEHNTGGPYQLDPTSDGFRFRSDQGEVLIQGVNINGYRLSCGQDALTLGQDLLDLDIQGKAGRWTLRNGNGRCVLSTPSPGGTLVFDRNANTFTIKGGQGQVTGTTQFEQLKLQSPLGTSTITTYLGQRTVAGIPLSQVPYLGRGLFIPFHGVGIFIDRAKVFPIPEVAEWVEWQPLVPGR